MTRRLLTFVIFVLVGCPPSGHVAVMPVQPPSEGAAPPPPRVAVSMSYGLVWTRHRVETPGCYFFSGPVLPQHQVVHPFGERAELSRVGDGIVVRIGDAEFAGSGETGHLERSRSFGSGDKWIVTETLDLDSSASPQGGTYRYRECRQSNPACESQCTIDSDFRFE